MFIFVTIFFAVALAFHIRQAPFMLDMQSVALAGAVAFIINASICVVFDKVVNNQGKKSELCKEEEEVELPSSYEDDWHDGNSSIKRTWDIMYIVIVVITLALVIYNECRGATFMWIIGIAAILMLAYDIALFADLYEYSAKRGKITLAYLIDMEAWNFMKILLAFTAIPAILTVLKLLLTDTWILLVAAVPAIIYVVNYIRRKF